MRPGKKFLSAHKILLHIGSPVSATPAATLVRMNLRTKASSLLPAGDVVVTALPSSPPARPSRQLGPSASITKETCKNLLASL